MFSISNKLTKSVFVLVAAFLLAASLLMPVSASAAATGDASQINVTSADKPNQYLNQAVQYFLQGGKRQGPDWLKTTDINFMFMENYKPVFSLETIQPFSQADGKGRLWFWQGRYAYENDASSTANLGIGWRKLSDDKSSLVGINAFYDYGFKYNLARIGAGLEYFNKLAEYRANFYFPTSGDRLVNADTSSYIRAVRGLDYEIGTSFTNARWLSLYAGGYYYDNKYSDAEKGYRLRSTMQVSPRFMLEMGYMKSNLTSGEFYGKIQYQMADVLSPARGKTANDISYKLLQKVHRENRIKTETFSKASAATPGRVVLTITEGGSIPGKDTSYNVTVTRDGVIIDHNSTGLGGVVMFNDLKPGPYTLSVVVDGYTYTHNVTVNSGYTVTVFFDTDVGWSDQPFPSS